MSLEHTFMKLTFAKTKLRGKSRIDDSCERREFTVTPAPHVSTGAAIDEFKRRQFGDEAGHWVLVAHEF
jgi:hypothetical protein